MAMFFSHLTLALTRLQQNAGGANFPPPTPPASMGDYDMRDYDSRDYFTG